MSTPIERDGVVEAHPAAAAEAALKPPDTASTGRPRRRHRVAVWVATLLALAAMVGGTALAVTSYLDVTSPRSVVERYLAALVRGDAPAALAYGVLPEGDASLLTSDVLLAQQATAPISDVAVLAVRETGDRASVDVRYQLGFEAGATPVTDTIELTRTGRTWRLAEVAVPLTIQLSGAKNRSSLAGAEIPVGQHLMFPGALPVRFDTDVLALSAVSRVVRFAETSDRPERVELTDAGRAAVDAAVDAALEACLAGTADAPELCPLPPDARAVPGTLRGATSAPASTVISVRVQPGPDGLLQIQGQVEVSGHYQQLDFNNQQVTESGQVTVSLTATCFASSPETIVWRSL